VRGNVLAISLVALLVGTGSPATRGDERTLINDNRNAAGTLRGGVLTLHIEARLGIWYPNGDDAGGVAFPAFAEERRAPEIPGPLIRVPAGTEVAVTVRNTLPNDTLVVHGLHDRVRGSVSAIARAGVRLIPGQTRALRFRLDAPGTYYYWGSTTGRDVNWRTGRDGQLTGAIIVDPAGAPQRPDRILVIGMWTDTVARAYVPRERILAVVNGLTWPNTERLRYDVGDTVRWRVINASGDNHPMHLHGFYFRVDSRGDGVGDTTYRADDADHVVTESMSPGATMRVTWVPERAGNWLFHCHIPEHFGRRGPLGLAPAAIKHATMNHAIDGMSGLIVGIEVKPVAGPSSQGVVEDRHRRHLRLLVRRNAGGSDEMPYFGFAIQDSATPPLPDSGLHVGPPLVLTRGEPVSITVVNTLAEPTAVHWHGIELESYYDGVAGFSGDSQRISPIVAPRDSFEARFTPPRAGTFIYHTHVDEERQQPAGLAGPIIVLEPGQRWDPSTDHPILITSPWTWEDGRNAVLVNGSAAPPPLVLRAGVRQRLRIINMTTRRPALRLELRGDSTLLPWRELARDGADFPESRRAARAAVYQISIGQTFDVEIMSNTSGDLHLDVRLGGNLPMHPVFATLPIRVVRETGGR
jgi:FtsP/CotA-like multicopper oxidase with cupredoxin domain